MSVEASVGLFVAHKGASMFVHEFLGYPLAEALGLPLLDIGYRLYGSEDASLPVLRLDEAGTFYSRIYGDLVRAVDYSALRLGIVVIRDPRDAAVSLFYSDAYSHPPLPDETAEERELRRARVQRLGLEQHLLEHALPRTCGEFLALRGVLAAKPAFLELRYEDMVGPRREPKFLEPVCRYAGARFDWTRARHPGTRRVADWRTAFLPPATVDPWSHRRRITPGEWRNVFTKRLIERTRDLCNLELEACGYRF